MKKDKPKDGPKVCGKCGGSIFMVEYAIGKHHYDGVSEIVCMDGKCGWRIGRWCEQQLTAGEVEPPFCQGLKAHPRVFDLTK